jgi:hypothetical protein
MKKRNPLYKLSDEPIGTQMSKNQLEKHLRKLRDDLNKYISKTKIFPSKQKKEPPFGNSFL